MEKIELKEVLPAAFAAGGPAVLRSEIWRREVTFRRGEFCLVEAASGAGKSSLCSFLYGIRGDYAGRILFDGVDCRTLSRAAWGDVRRTSLSLLFQDLRLFGELTVAENIALKNDLTRFQTAERIDGLLEAAGIADKRDTPVGLLSFGQRQRVAFVRALCQPFDFMLARRAGEPPRRRERRGARGVARVRGPAAGGGRHRYLGRQPSRTALR